jgi:ricin-type beta-trefoil lectin protein/putative metal-binding protein
VTGSSFIWRAALVCSLLIWCAAPVARAAAAPYNLRAAHSGRCLDVTGGPGAIANGTGIQQWDCLGPGQSNQMWNFKPSGDGSTYTVTALNSGRCLDVRGGTGALSNGTLVQQWDCLGYAQANQRWQVSSSGDGSTYYLKAVHSGRCLDVRGGLAATGNGAVLQQWDCLGYAQANQRWYFTRGDAVPVVPDLDGDGFDGAHDCNDADPNVHPGATDAPGDGIDEDCSGSDATAPVDQPGQGSTDGGQGTAEGRIDVLFVRVVNVWTVHTRGTRVVNLALRGAPSGTRVTVTCRGHGCPFARRSRRASGGNADLGGPFKHRLLKAGTKLVLHLQLPNVGQYEVRFQMRAGALPHRTDYCPSDTKTKLRRCG